MTKVLIGDIAGPAGPTGPTGPAGADGAGAPTTASQNAVFAGPSSGGSGATSMRALVAADMPSLSYIASTVMTALGDILYGAASGVATRLAGNTTATKKFLTQTGTGSASAAPTWGTLASGDIPNNAANTTGTAANFTGGATLPAYLAPKDTTLTDGSSIATDASLGNDFTVTIAGNRTMAAPSNPRTGQKIMYEIIQDSTGSRTITWTTGTGGFSFGGGSAPTLSTGAGKVDLVAFRYSPAAGGGTGRWCYMGSGLTY